jgi:hypothetical protein
MLILFMYWLMLYNTVNAKDKALGIQPEYVTNFIGSILAWLVVVGLVFWASVGVDFLREKLMSCCGMFIKSVDTKS